MGKAKLTFEKALEALERIVSEIEAGKVPLEESIDKYAQGVKLVERCREILDSAEAKIQLLAKGKGNALEEAGELTDEDVEAPSDPSRD